MKDQFWGSIAPFSALLCLQACAATNHYESMEPAKNFTNDVSQPKFENTISCPKEGESLIAEYLTQKELKRRLAAICLCPQGIKEWGKKDSPSEPHVCRDRCINFKMLIREYRILTTYPNRALFLRDSSSAERKKKETETETKPFSPALEKMLQGCMIRHFVGNDLGQVSMDIFNEYTLRRLCEKHGYEPEQCSTGCASFRKLRSLLRESKNKSTQTKSLEIGHRYRPVS